MFIRKENQRVICEALFREGVLWAQKNKFLPRHPEIPVPNIEVLMLMKSFKSKEYVKETYNWRTYYYSLTDKGLDYLRTFLNFPEEMNVVPNTWKPPKTVTSGVQRDFRRSEGGGRWGERGDRSGGFRGGFRGGQGGGRGRDRGFGDRGGRFARDGGGSGGGSRFGSGGDRSGGYR